MRNRWNTLLGPDGGGYSASLKYIISRKAIATGQVLLLKSLWWNHMETAFSIIANRQWVRSQRQFRRWGGIGVALVLIRSIFVSLALRSAPRFWSVFSSTTPNSHLKGEVMMTWGVQKYRKMYLGFWSLSWPGFALKQRTERGCSCKPIVLRCAL